MKRLVLFILVAFVTVGNLSAMAESTFVTIGTGSVAGLYYPTGGAIAMLMNKKKETLGIRATVESTRGSVENINSVLRQDFEFGLTQSDRQYQAMNGLAEWAMAGPQKKLRSVCSIYPESVTLVAAADSMIFTIQDLRGKIVNIGNHGSGQRQNAIDALEAAGLNYKTDLRAESFEVMDAADLLQNGRIDAYFYTVGHPSKDIDISTSGERKVRIANIDDITGLLAKYPYYAPATIPISNYPNAVNEKDVKTFGVKATLITNAAVPEHIVYAMTRELFENLAEFKKFQPAYVTLTAESMLEGLSAPLHPGALRYFKEVGLR